MGDRTPDLRTASAALSQLSYSPEGSATLAENLSEASQFDAAREIIGPAGLVNSEANRLTGRCYGRAAEAAPAGGAAPPVPLSV